MKDIRGTRANIPPRSRAHINARATAYPRIQRTELAKKLQAELEAMQFDVPEIEVLERMISKFRKGNGHPKDKPFYLGALVDYPIPPEALPMVLRVWAKRLEEAKPNKDGFSFQMSFTIRDALWVSRLSHLDKDPEKIWGTAFWYSVRERAYEAIGEDIDTTDLDTELIKNFRLLKSKPKKKGR